MRWIARASTLVAGITLALIVLTTTVAIFYRYFLGTPIIVTEELSRALLIIMAYCGSIALPHLREHMAVEFVYDMCSPRVQRWLDIFHHLVGTAFLGLLAYSGYLLATKMAGIRLPALQIPVSYLFGVIAAACGLHALVYAGDAINGILGRQTSEPAPRAEDKVAL